VPAIVALTAQTGPMLERGKSSGHIAFVHGD